MITDTLEIRMMPRAVVVPLVVAEVLISALIILALYGISYLEMRMDHRGYSMPEFSLLFANLLPWIWAVPILALVVGIDLCRRRQISYAYMAWYGALGTTLIVFWLAFGSIAIYLAHVKKAEWMSHETRKPTPALLRY